MRRVARGLAMCQESRKLMRLISFCQLLMRNLRTRRRIRRRMTSKMTILSFADKALKSLSLDANPLPVDDDDDNGADLDVLPDSDMPLEEDSSLPTQPATFIFQGCQETCLHGCSGIFCRGRFGSFSFAQTQERRKGSTYG